MSSINVVNKNALKSFYKIIKGIIKNPKSLTQTEYNSLSNEEKGNGVAYFVPDGGEALLISQLINDSTSGFLHKGEINLSALPTNGMQKGWYYYIIDTGDGRYYDGTNWKVVK